MRVNVVVWVRVGMVMCAGCADTLATRDSQQAEPDGGMAMQSGAFSHTVDAKGVTTTVVDANDHDVWRFLDLDTMQAAEADGDWDLAFNRFRVRTNGGVSGRGGVRAARSELDFDQLSQAPVAGWSVDRASADDETDPRFTSAFVNVFNSDDEDAHWYDYDRQTHTLTPKPIAYVVASTQRRFYKLRFLAYYSSAGTPGILTFQWAEIDPPASPLPDAGVVPADDAGWHVPPTPVPMPDAGTDTGGDGGASEPGQDGRWEVDASDREAWVYVRVGSGAVSVSDPGADLGWDLALRRTEVRTNSGTSGPGMGGAVQVEMPVAFEDIAAAPASGFVVDEVVASDRPGAVPTSANPVLTGWYDYDSATHAVTAGERNYVLRTAQGSYAKLRFWHWSNGHFVLSLLPLPVSR